MQQPYAPTSRDRRRKLVGRTKCKGAYNFIHLCNQKMTRTATKTFIRFKLFSGTLKYGTNV